MEASVRYNSKNICQTILATVYYNILRCYKIYFVTEHKKKQQIKTT